MQYVLITRAEPDASETAAKVRLLGYRPLVAPIFAHNTHPLSIRSADHIAAVLLTSRNAIPSCPPYLYHKPVYAVGPATANRASQVGFVNVVNADGDAGTLVARISQDLTPLAGSLLLPTAPGQGFEPADALRKQGFHVLRRVAYETVKMPLLPPSVAHTLSTGNSGFALVFSTESARHFVRLLLAAGLGETTRNVTAVAISERPIMALRRLPWRSISVAARPNQDAMLALLHE